MNGMDKLRSSIIVLLCCLVVIGALKGMLLIMKVAIGILAVFLLVLILRKIFIINKPFFFLTYCHTFLKFILKLSFFILESHLVTIISYYLQNYKS